MAIQLFVKDQRIQIDFKQFSGGERHVQIDSALLHLMKDYVKIRAELNHSDDILDYLLLENVLLAECKNIRLEIPYFPYARQDRVCAEGQAFSLAMFCHLLDANAKQYPEMRRNIMIWDAHSAVTEQLLAQSEYNVEVCNIQPVHIISTAPELNQQLLAQDTVLICPDQGAESRTTAVAEYFNQNRINPLHIIHCRKSRNPSTGKITSSVVHSDDLTGKTAVITDDICDGGATFIGIAEQLKKLHCKHVILYVTHGIFSRGLEVFDGLVDQIFTTNSRPQQPHSKLHVIEFEAI